MSKVICIPCLNLHVAYDYVIHRHSMAKCSLCGEKRQGLLVSITGYRRVCDIEEGCDKIQIQYICKEQFCPYRKLLTGKKDV